MTIFAELTTEYDTAANWASTNPVLGANVMALETDTGRAKIGNGLLAYNSLPYMDTPDSVLAARMMATLSAPLKTTWADKPSASAVSVGAQIRVVDTWTPPQGIVFVSDGTYWRPLNGQCLLYKWDLSGISTSQTTSGSVAGFSSPTFPWDDLLAVPGCSLSTNLTFTRTNPASSQAWRAVVRFAGTSINLCFLSGTNTNPGGRSSGRNEYANSTQITDSPNGPPYGNGFVSFPTVSRPSNAAVDLQAQTGDTGGTEVIQFHTLQMVYSA